jgi:hypothetical protein
LQSAATACPLPKSTDKAKIFNTLSIPMPIHIPLMEPEKFPSENIRVGDK